MKMKQQKKNFIKSDGIGSALLELNKKLRKLLKDRAEFRDAVDMAENDLYYTEGWIETTREEIKKLKLKMKR